MAGRFVKDCNALVKQQRQIPIRLYCILPIAILFKCLMLQQLFIAF
jgi:hypothetical protein